MFRLQKYKQAIENFIEYQHHRFVKYPFSYDMINLRFLFDTPQLMNLIKDNHEVLRDSVSKFPTIAADDWNTIGNSLADNLAIERLLCNNLYNIKLAKFAIPGSKHYTRLGFSQSSRITYKDVQNFVEEAGLTDLNVDWGSPGWFNFITKESFLSGHTRVMQAIESEETRATNKFAPPNRMKYYCPK
jgi:hypothetical protein